MKKYTIFLICGLVATVLFLTFATPLYEGIFYDREFSNEMYNGNLYIIVAMIASLVSWGVAGLFYYAINSVSFSRWYHWLCMLVAVVVLTFGITYFYCNSCFPSEYDFDSQLFRFCLKTSWVEVVLFIIASFSMRWWSSNCRHTPLPE